MRTFHFISVDNILIKVIDRRFGGEQQALIQLEWDLECKSIKIGV